MKPTPYRGSEELQKIQQRLECLEETDRFRQGEMELLKGLVLSLQDTLEQMQAVMECGSHPAPVFLRWQHGTEEGRSVAKATFGKYLLEVFNGSSAPSWSIKDAKGNWFDAGGHPHSFTSAMDDCEAALRRLIQAKQPPKPI